MNGYNVRNASWQCDNHALRSIREKVFIREQGVPVELEWDEFDASCIHALAADSAGNPIGTARFLPVGTIGRMAVLKEWRGKGVGGALLQWLLQEAGDRQFQQVALNAQIYAAGFYAKFGFRIEGEKFLDAGIPHVKMVLRL
ncbi:GNAT family N-acetyltransferase [Nitrosovibrio sp. Nv6]|uniref:GNAT family N-acetyltransferase n=1 Tax=Nitrosovibrio sp. Nv6 TaxID=1855340 RepID=UPI0008C0E008|nr:GNAT family N-acetyltransferase [Nitrosovibrio sp. Nv6]SEP05550.1 Predicted N-acyltransferase, GNAT family [Nitrosovibrio sp. Nv6]